MPGKRTFVDEEAEDAEATVTEDDEEVEDMEEVEENADDAHEDEVEVIKERILEGILRVTTRVLNEHTSKLVRAQYGLETPEGDESDVSTVILSSEDEDAPPAPRKRYRRIASDQGEAAADQETQV